MNGQKIGGQEEAGGIVPSSPEKPLETLIVTKGSAASQPPLACPTFFPSIQFGDYEILGEIARGAMGVVFRARHVRLGRTVALKRIMAGEFASEEAVKRFLSEAHAAAGLKHPGIVTIYEVGEREGQHYFSMELVEGGSLQAHIKHGPLESAEAARIVKCVAEALAVAHAGGVVHRDLKPDNILIGTDGQPKITDFGLAKELNGTAGLTAPGYLLGTPSYMAPEQANGDTSMVGPASDIYALGGVLYTLLTGHPPFQSGALMEMLRQVVEDEPRRLREVDPTISAELEAIVYRCLRKDVSRRYQSASDLAADLGRWLAGESVEARAPSLFGRTTSRLRRRFRAPDLVLLACATAACLGSIYWAVYLRVDPYAHLRREETDHLVAQYRARPLAVVDKPHPSRQMVPALTPPDPSAFETVERMEVYDFQSWKPLPRDRSAKLVSPVTCLSRRRIRKLKPVEEFRDESRTTGYDIFFAYESHISRLREFAEQTPGLVGGLRMKVRQFVLDVSEIAVDQEFEVVTRRTLWDADYEGPDKRWVGAMVRDRPHKISLLVIFPSNRPLKQHRLRIADLDGQGIRPYDGEQLVIEGAGGNYLFWEILRPLPQQVYRIDWEW